jgi:aminoglycoside phosphotransferase (APT) family kinase protein
MGTRPAAEVDVTTGLVRRLLVEQHPDLAHLDLRPVTTGWDNALLRLGDRLAVRIPRRASAAPLVEHEQRWLPQLAPRLGVDIPSPVRAGRPSPTFPWAWSVVPWFGGRVAASLPPAARRDLAVPLADVVVRLHVPAPADAPVNPVRGVPLRDRDAVVRERLASGVVPEPDRVTDLWDRALAAPPWDGPALWLHGDLHPANLLVDDDDGAGHGLAAVLDFGDLTAGDPATDLATAWLTFDATGRAAFRDRVARASGGPDGPGGPDAATWRRARGWALVLATAMLAHSDDDPVIAAIGRHALAEVLAG